MPIRFLDIYDSLFIYIYLSSRHLRNSCLATSSQGNPYFVDVELKQQWIGELPGISRAVTVNRALRNRRDSDGRCLQFLSNLGVNLPGSGIAALPNRH